MALNYPVEIRLDRARALEIRWNDGFDAAIPLARLRLACPCAVCRAAREAQAANPLRVIQSPASTEQMATAESAELVGNYALRVKWRDGHDTGIYDFGLLRSLSAPASDKTPAD